MSKLLDRLLPKDFIASREGWLFAVVSEILEEDRVLGFLRYAMLDGAWRKLNSDQANEFLATNAASYLYHSSVLDARLHAVARPSIVKHYSPRATLKRLMAMTTDDSVIQDFQQLTRLLADAGVDCSMVGVTGSLLVGMQHHASDIDLVCYDREVFHQMRRVVQALIAENHCQALNESDWLTTYQRRSCDFSLDDYVWHELRKYNKGMINGRKFDLSLVVPSMPAPPSGARKLGAVHIAADVINDHHAFDYPARLDIRHPVFDQVLSFTATYAGQAQRGETIEVAGQAEIDDEGRHVIIVGSSREAVGEYIRVMR